MKHTRENSLKAEIVSVSRRCGTNGWCPGTSGNISIFNPKQGRVYIKKSGADMNKLALRDILTIDLEGNILNGKGKPSMEVNFHLGIYKTREEARAVLHIHPPFATAFATAAKSIPLVTETAKTILGVVPLINRATPGSVELAKNVIDCFKDINVKALLLREHGIVSIEETLEKAYYVADYLEDTAKIAFLTSIIESKK